MERREEKEEEGAAAGPEDDAEEDDEAEGSGDDEEQEDGVDDDKNNADRKKNPIKKGVTSCSDKKCLPGIIYLGHIPPRMRPKHMRNMLSAYGEIGRIFLQPEGNVRGQTDHFKLVTTKICHHQQKKKRKFGNVL